MPDDFLIFGGGYRGDGFDEFRESIWQRSRGKGPTAFRSFEKIFPKSLIPRGNYNRDLFPIDEDKDPIPIFEKAKLVFEFFAYLKNNRWTLEKGIYKGNGSTSSSHRRMYFSSISQARRFVRVFIPSGKIQIEDNHFRAHFNRKGTRLDTYDSYLLEDVWERQLGPDWVSFDKYLVPTDDKQYFQNLISLPEYEQFTQEEIDELWQIWTTVEMGYVVGETDINKETLTYDEKMDYERLGSLRKREGAIIADPNKGNHRVRARLRQDLLKSLRLQDKKNGNIFTPACDICGKVYPDTPFALSHLEVMHTIPISRGDRETALDSLRLGCCNCHSGYTYHERKFQAVEQFVGYDRLVAAVRYSQKELENQLAT